jgi:hypothetical protein
MGDAAVGDSIYLTRRKTSQYHFSRFALRAHSGATGQRGQSPLRGRVQIRRMPIRVRG